MKDYYCEGWAGWFVVRTDNKRKARSEAGAEFGRGFVKDVREATDDETSSFVEQKGERALAG